MQAFASPILTAENIVFGYDNHPVLHGASLALCSGDLVALIGPNGSGKTTILKLLSGILEPQQGRILWDGQSLRAADRRARARRIAVVPQELNIPFAFSVAEIVGLGRTPHLRTLSIETQLDREAVSMAMRMTGIQNLANRLFGELSGGEQQRTVIAMALAQIAPGMGEEGARVLLLDEPTVHLDINHQLEILELVRKLNRDFHLAVLATMHDLNLAAMYFDRLVLLKDGKIVTEGEPSIVLSKERVKDVFDTEVLVQPHPARQDVPHVILMPTNGNGH